MLKTLTKDDTTTTPYVATKDWNLSNVANEDIVLSEAGNPIAAENVDYLPDTVQPNYNCNVAKENQDLDLANYREGLNVTGLFYPNLDPQNIDGTYKRLVYAQVKTMFYNNFRDPTKVWGTEKIDFDTSQTKKFLSDYIKLIDIPTNIMGQKIVEKSVSIVDNTLDNDYLITDDGNCNLFAGTNLFSKQQELGDFRNQFQSGSDSGCDIYFNPAVPSTPALVATYNSGVVNLNWSAPEGATGYYIQRAVGTGSFSLLAIVMGINSYVDTGVSLTGSLIQLLSSTSYSYEVSAFNDLGSSSYSNIEIVPQGSFDTFDEYFISQSINFNSGSGWSNSWIIDEITKFVGIETFDEYIVAQTGSFNSGSGWNNMWNIPISIAKFVGIETFNEYRVGQTSNFTGSNYIWETDWVIK